MVYPQEPLPTRHHVVVERSIVVPGRLPAPRSHLGDLGLCYRRANALRAAQRDDADRRGDPDQSVEYGRSRESAR